MCGEKTSQPGMGRYWLEYHLASTPGKWYSSSFRPMAKRRKAVAAARKEWELSVQTEGRLRATKWRVTNGGPKVYKTFG